MEKHYSQLFYKLKQQNLKPEQLALIEQERCYIQKLKMQRIKIQQLTTKYQILQTNFTHKQQQCNNLQQIIMEKQRKIQDLIMKSEEDKINYENGKKMIQKNYQLDNQLLTKQVIVMKEQRQSLCLKIKQKQIQIYQTKTHMQRRQQKIKQQHKWQLKQLEQDYENNKVRIQQNQIEDYKILIQRQNKTLKAQDQQCQTLLCMNMKLQQEINNLRNWQMEQKEKYLQIIEVLNSKIKQLEDEILKQKKDYSIYTQVQELRRKMGNIAKEQIHKIQQLVSELN